METWFRKEKCMGCHNKICELVDITYSYIYL